MLATSGSQATISFFLRLHRLKSPGTISRKIMSDFCWPQINACIAEYQAFILLCWWHVLHAWQQHFHISSHPDLWTILKKWLRITDQVEFDATWAEIQIIAPPDFVQYLIRYWMPVQTVKMWSAIYRTPRSILEACDTNMLIEAWHHVLKFKFLLGKRNRRLDHLLNTLVNGVLPYYALKQRRQELGFEGPDIEIKKRQDIIKRSKVYVKEDIQHIDDSRYLVPSQSDPSKLYDVDIETYTCNCLDYPLICYCKHLCAVQELFDEPDMPTDRAQSSPQVPSLSTLDDPLQIPFLVSNPPILDIPNLGSIAQKLERLSARLRRPRADHSKFPLLSDLELVLDEMLMKSDNGTVLPSSQHIMPNSKESRCRETMMPRVKTRSRRAGDPAYGGNASSGSKSKESKSVSVTFASHC
ncbi:hypothetical protein B0H15DRAFT_788251 [Mycena belliarum]|uniref:SWIM-type domain-containing protein n=1 Tax=Mycena belliarum TaxID=1033014 RepID=A0AAD6XJL4_9AGAR|nr:hypothetical protein B0H15DRAFT_788251 [Mycena belliae]